MSLLKKSPGLVASRTGTYPSRNRFSTDNLLLILTMLVFGYCFLYVSLPFMLHKSAVAVPTQLAHAIPAPSEHLTQPKQDNK